MTDALHWLVPALAAVAFAGVPLYALRVRGGTYAGFATAILVISMPGALVTHARLAAWAAPDVQPWLHAAFAWGVAAAGLHLAHLVRARLRGRVFRVAVSAPGQVFVAAGVLAGVWQLFLLPLRALVGWGGGADVVAALRLLDPLPFAVAGLSIITSTRDVTEWVRLPDTASDGAGLVRLPVERTRRRAPTAADGSTLRIVQVADPHLGPWQSVARLRRTLCELVAHDPHLVLLTGDFLTMEGEGTPGALAEALSPLRPVAKRCYAIFGNHDHGALAEVRGALAANGVRLLVDEEVVAQTPVGPVQIIGADYVRRGRGRHLASLLAEFPRRPGHARLLLLHDPSAFRHVPDAEVDLTLSGHTHGGQVGLLSVGLDWTMLRRTPWPDHGLFARAGNLLYVHRGTGFYGFPLRMGVPGERSVLEFRVGNG